MTIKVMSEFIAKATVRTRVHVYNDAGTLTEPTSVQISIWDPDGGDPVVDAVEIVVDGKVEDGIYGHYYKTTTASKKGWWRGQADVVDGVDPDDITSVGTFGFRIK